ncbi:MAG: F0F1 ATP synthase subunit B [Acidimicrobiales bacterium]
MLASSGTTNFIIPNATFFVELVIFIVVLGIVAKFVLPPIQKVMSERDDSVRREQESAEASRKEAARLDTERLQTLADARARARAILQEASRKVEDLLQEARRRGQEEHDRRVRDAAGAIDAERERVRAELLERAETLVVEAAERIVGGGLDASRHRQLIVEELQLADRRARKDGGRR